MNSFLTHLSDLRLLVGFFIPEINTHMNFKYHHRMTIGETIVLLRKVQKSKGTKAFRPFGLYNQIIRVQQLKRLRERNTAERMIKKVKPNEKEMGKYIRKALTADKEWHKLDMFYLSFVDNKFAKRPHSEVITTRVRYYKYIWNRDKTIRWVCGPYKNQPYVNTKNPPGTNVTTTDILCSWIFNPKKEHKRTIYRNRYYEYEDGPTNRRSAINVNHQRRVNKASQIRVR